VQIRQDVYRQAVGQAGAVLLDDLPQRPGVVEAVESRDVYPEILSKVSLPALIELRQELGQALAVPQQIEDGEPHREVQRPPGPAVLDVREESEIAGEAPVLVLGGLEVLATLDDARIVTRRPLAVAFFTNEEGSRFAPDMLGSLTYVGGMGVAVALEQIAIDGARLGTELERIGYRCIHRNEDAANYLRGDERLLFEHFDDRVPELRVQLPGLRAGLRTPGVNRRGVRVQ
jgi:hypothetical protein